MKTVLVTGANKGIGYAIAAALGQKNVHVLLGSRSVERGQQALTQMKAAGVAQVDLIQLDLSDTQSIDAAIATITKQFNDLDVVINNAGIPGKPVPNDQLTMTDLAATMQVNFFGTVQLTNGLMPLLKQNHGRVVNITIPTDANPLFNPMAYKTSKAALNAWTTTLAVDFEQAELPLKAFSVHPGPTTTDLNGNLTYPGFHTADEVAAKLVPDLLADRVENGAFVELYPQIRG